MLLSVNVIGCLVMVSVSWRGLWSWTATPGSFFGGDHEAYRAGAERLLASGSPYHAALADGPIPNHVGNVVFAYLYPPPLAQLFVGLRLVDPVALAWLAAALQMVVLLVLAPLIYRRYGGGSSAVETVSTWLFVLASWPIHMALFGGNLSGWLAIAVALMLVASGPVAAISAVLAGVLKFTPMALVVLAIFYRPTRLATLVTLATVLVFSMVMDPSAWISWVSVLPNILRFPTGNSPANFAPAALLGSVGLGGLGLALSFAIAAVAAVASIWLSWKGLWAAAVAAGVAAILYGSGSTWDHYLAPTIPLVLAAMPKATWAVRGVFAAFAVATALMWLGTVALSDFARVAFLLVTMATSAVTIVTLASMTSGMRPGVADAAHGRFTPPVVPAT